MKNGICRERDMCKWCGRGGRICIILRAYKSVYTRVAVRQIYSSVDNKNCVLNV